MAKARVPKDVGGVAIPPELRRLGNRLIGRVDSRIGREALTAGITLAAAAVIAMSGQSDTGDGSSDEPDAPEPPIAPEPPKPPVPPTPPVPPAAPEPTVRPAAAARPEPRASVGPQITPAQAQAMTDALGNVAQAALARFLAGRRPI